MVRIPHSPNDQLRTLQHALLAIAPCISAPEGAVRVCKVQIGNGLPDMMNLIRR